MILVRGFYMNRLIIAFSACLLVLGGCASSSTETTSGFVTGEIGEKIETMFYQFTLTEPYTISTVNGISASEDKEYLIVEMTIQNTESVSIEMADTEFCAAWGDGENDYTAPTTYYNDALLDENQFPSSYKLKAGESKTGLLIYEVPADQSIFTIYCRDSYIDKDGNSANGAEYDIAFTADQR